VKFYAWLRMQAQTFRTRSTAAVHHASVRWMGFSARERALVGFAAFFVLLAIVWAGFVRPALQTIENAQTSIPQLRAELVQIQAMVLEAKSLNRQVSGAIPDQQIRGAIEESLKNMGLASGVRLQEEGVDDDTGRRWRVVFTGSSAAAVLGWLSEVPYALRLQINTADLARAVVSGRSQPDLLSGEVVLQKPEEAIS
tara:strand:- start:238 stop:828 length:591 start_codon:yes stop_codon:yes gene_type:complete